MDSKSKVSKNFAYFKLKKDISNFANLAEEIRDDEDVVKYVLTKDPSMIKYISERLKDDFDIVKQAVKTKGDLIRFASERLKNDVEMAKIAISEFGGSYEHIGEKLKDNKELILLATKSFSSILRIIDKKFCDDDDIVDSAILKNPKVIEFASRRIRSDKDRAVRLIDKNRMLIEYLDDSIFYHREVLEKFVRPKNKLVANNVIDNQTPLGVFKGLRKFNFHVYLVMQQMNLLLLSRDKFYNLLFVCDNNFSDREKLLHKYVDLDDGDVVKMLLDKEILPKNKTLMELSFARNKQKLKVLPYLLEYTKDMVVDLFSVQEDNRTKLLNGLKRKSKIYMRKFIENFEMFQDDEEMVEHATYMNVSALGYADELIRNDEEFVGKLIENYAVDYASEPIMKFVGEDLVFNYELCLSSVEKDGRNFAYCAKSVQEIKEIALVAVRANGSYYFNLSEKLKADEDIIKEKKEFFPMDLQSGNEDNENN